MDRLDVPTVLVDVTTHGLRCRDGRLVGNSARWQFRLGRITRSMEIIAPTADCSYACRALPNINRFQVNALGQSVPRSLFGTTLA